MQQSVALKDLPTEIKGHLLIECLRSSVKDMTSLLCTDKSFYKAATTVVWRELYHKLYKNHDEFDVDKPTHEIKIFLRNFLPSTPQAGNKDWLKAVILRATYDEHLLAAVVGKTAIDRSGWKTVPHEKSRPHNFHYKKNLTNEDTYRYGFDYNFAPVTAILEDIGIKFHLCFLELTLGRFFEDPTAFPISAIDYFHFTKVVNVHIVYATYLCSKPIPDPVPGPEEKKSGARSAYNNFNGSEPIFLNGDNLEYTIQPGREWGVYTNYACQGFLWGRELDELLKNKYKVDISLYDTKLFVPNPNYQNFSNLTQ